LGVARETRSNLRLVQRQLVPAVDLCCPGYSGSLDKQQRKMSCSCLYKLWQSKRVRQKKPQTGSGEMLATVGRDAETQDEHQRHYFERIPKRSRGIRWYLTW